MNFSNSRMVRMAGAGLLATTLTLSLAACGEKATTAAAVDDGAQSVTSAVSEPAADTASTSAETVVTTAQLSTTGVIDTTDLFTERDLTQVADVVNATHLTLTSGEDIQITEEGTYVITGEATDVTIVVEAADTAKVQLVLDGTSITNADFPAIYVKSADKVFVTTVEGTTSTLQVTGAFVADGETNTDAVIFSRDDLVLNGLGTLQVNSTANGVSSKDDLKVTGGTYVFTTTGDALEANDSIAVAEGSFTLTTSKDGLHSENDEDDTQGFIYICGGSFDITAEGDGIQASTYLQIDGGSLSIDASEALEATYVQVNGGDLNLSASDDGINGAAKSASVGTPTIEITNGSLTISMGAGDTDALDVNGNLIVSGGNIDITGQSAFDYDGTASFTGGTITVNGEQVSEISNSMMGGGMGPGMGAPMGEMPEGGPGTFGGRGGGRGPQDGQSDSVQA